MPLRFWMPPLSARWSHTAFKNVKIFIRDTRKNERPYYARCVHRNLELMQKWTENVVFRRQAGVCREPGIQSSNLSGVENSSTSACVNKEAQKLGSVK